MDRRTFLKAGLATVGVAAMTRQLPAQEFPPVRAITSGPKFHWFGYYDKDEFDPTNRYVLSNQIGFEHRTPNADDSIKVGMVDLQDGNKWIELGESRAFGWQQGCMLQWRPGTQSEVIWNDRQGDKYVSHVLDVKTGQKRTINTPVYTLSPDGSFAMTADFSRIQSLRPGYGYVGIPDPNADDYAPKDSGVFRVDLNTGEKTLVLSLRQMAEVPFPGQDLKNAAHWFNHLLISPDGRRFIVLHRWKLRDPKTGQLAARWSTRMLTANVDGSDVFILNPEGIVSHFVWKDPDHVCMWTKPADKPAGFYVYKDRTREIEQVGAGVMVLDGHNTYVNGHPDWILCDGYPEKGTRFQRPYLYHQPTNKRIDLGTFHLPPEYTGEWRCDLHPRTSRDGRLVAIDSPHGGNGRQVYLIDIASIIENV